MSTTYYEEQEFLNDSMDFLISRMIDLPEDENKERKVLELISKKQKLNEEPE